MTKDEFVSKIANRLNASPAVIEAAVDASLAEMLAPTLFGPEGARRIAFDNNCGNNCAAELARATPVSGVIVR